MYLTSLPRLPLLSILLLFFVSFSILNLLLSTHIFLSSVRCLSFLFYIPWSLAFSHFLSAFPAIFMISFIFTMLCFHFLSLPFFLLLSAPMPLLLLQSLYVRGRCCGCRRPALCRRQSTRQGHGVRTRCSLGTVCTLCPGPPIAPTCCTSMPPGKTSNRTEPPPPTSEGASHCPG